MNLFSAAERLAAMDRSKIHLDTNCCLHSLDKFSECNECISVCPVDAIKSCKPPTLDVETCTYCLACLPTCPTGAIQGNDVLKGLLNCIPRIPEGGVELVCEKMTTPPAAYPDSGTMIRVRGCLAGLGPGALAGVIAAEVSSLRLRIDACDTCHFSELEAQIRNQVQAVTRFLEPWGMGNAISCCPDPGPNAGIPIPIWDADNPPLSRRDLFRIGTRQGSLALARAMNAEGETHTQKVPPRERRRLLGAADHLSDKPKQLSSNRLEGLHWGWVSITPGCVACGVCARICPTGAIDFFCDEVEKTFRLNFHPEACTACGACIHSCAAGAIELQDAPSFAQVFSPQETILFEGGLKRCYQCNTWIPEQRSSRLCPICEYRKKNPFGSAMPPGFQPRVLPVKRDQET